MRRRIVATLAVASLLLVAGGAIVPPAPASAAVRSPVEVSGNFAGDAREEVFAYVAGPEPDYMISFSNEGTSCSPLSWETYEFGVGGTYYPVAGDFDDDGYDEIIWHAPGAAPDYMWHFPTLDTSLSTPLAVGGDYIPIAGDFSGDTVSDVIWYAPGTTQDYLWDFNPGVPVWRENVPLTVNGFYRPVAASFGFDVTDDVIWYGPGTARDYLWDFVAGTHLYAARRVIINGDYQPFALDIFGDGAGGGDAYWYAPGPARDYLWDFIGGQYGSYEEGFQVDGFYRATAGDYLNDGHDDILWVAEDGSGFQLWDHYPAPGGGIARCEYSVIGSPGSATAVPEAGPTGVDGTPAGPVERTGG